MKTYAGIVALTLIVSVAGASEPIPFDSPRWEIEAEESRIEEHQGKKSLYMRGGLALIKDADFMNGVIEFQCAFPQARAFVGATWRVQDADDREEFYIRPHQSGNPDANQYTPVFNGLPGWQLYHGEGYGIAVDYDFDSWIPIRIVVAGRQAEVFIGDLETPALFIDHLKRDPASGKIGLSVADFGPAHFADFRYEAVENPSLKGVVERKRTAPPGSLMTWQVSGAFAEKNLEAVAEFPTSVMEGLAWSELLSEPTGLANLSVVNALSREKNTAVARVTVFSDRTQSKTLAFGYSDRIRVYLNNRLIYAGNNGYRSRDYRYLGTIGYFDSLTLPLQKGRNELWLAVSESFGGWGVQAALSDTEGLIFTND
jgi:hypothetical protein